MHKKINNLLIISLCILMMSCMMTGCRKSPALVDNIYTKDATEVDPEQLASSMDTSGEQDELKTEQDNEQDITEQTRTAAFQDTNSNNSGETRQASPSEYGSDSAGTNSSEESGSAAGAEDGNRTGNDSSENVTGAESSDAPQNIPTNPDTPQVTPADSDTPQDEPQDTPVNPDIPQDILQDNPTNPDIPSGGNGNETPTKWDLPRKTVTDGNGTEQNIPRDVYTVTAVGAAAPIVEMVGGSGRLLASSASFTGGQLANTICPDVMAGAVQTWWADDGTDPIDDNCFQTLLNESPDVCFVVGGQRTFDSNQLAALQEAGIGYVPLPELNSVANMKEAVNIVAAVLETNETTHEPAKNIARNYSDWVDQILSESSCESKHATMVISGWDASAVWYTHLDWGQGSETFELYNYQLGNDFFAQDYRREDGYVTLDRIAYGAAVGWGHGMKSCTPLSELLQAANVTVAGLNISDADMFNVPFVPGTEGKYQYYIGSVIPFLSYASNGTESGQIGFSLSVQNIFYDFRSSMSGREWKCTACVPGLERDKTLTYLGSAGIFDSIIAENPDAKTALERNSLWRYYTSAEWKDITGKYPVGGYGTDICGPYTIYVNPYGFSSWLYGGVDSPLESLWAACKIDGTVSESKLRSEVDSFYMEFFGVVPDYNSIVTR